jgi:hypothetical protein
LKVDGLPNPHTLFRHCPIVLHCVAVWFESRVAAMAGRFCHCSSSHCLRSVDCWVDGLVAFPSQITCEVLKVWLCHCGPNGRARDSMILFDDEIPSGPSYDFAAFALTRTQRCLTRLAGVGPPCERLSHWVQSMSSGSRRTRSSQSRPSGPSKTGCRPMEMGSPRRPCRVNEPAGNITGLYFPTQMGLVAGRGLIRLLFV